MYYETKTAKTQNQENNCFREFQVTIEAVRGGGQQEQRPLSTPQGSRVAQWAWGTMQHKRRGGE